MIAAPLELETTPAKTTHAERLAAAAARTAAARREVDDHAALAAEVDRLKALAVGGELDDKGAAALLKKSESLRLGEIVLPRRKKALDDAQAAEVKEALEVLGELADKLEPMKAEAEEVADRLTGLLVHPEAATIRSDTSAGFERDRGRCAVESFMPGVFPAAMLAERIRIASTVTWGAGHVPQAAAGILADFDNELVSIRSGIAALRAATGALEKLSA